MKIAVKADIYIRACISQRNGIEWTLTLRRSSICVSTRGCLSYRVQLQGSIWCWDRMVPPSVPSVLTKGLVREGHREEEWMGYVFYVLLLHFQLIFFIHFYVKLGWWDSPIFLIEYTPITFLGTEQSHDSFAFRLPTTQQIYSCLICFIYFSLYNTFFFFF